MTYTDALNRHTSMSVVLFGIDFSEGNFPFRLLKTEEPLLLGVCSIAGVVLETFFFLVSCLSIWFEESSDILIIITIAAKFNYSF